MVSYPQMTGVIVGGGQEQQGRRRVTEDSQHITHLLVHGVMLARANPRGC